MALRVASSQRLAAPVCHQHARNVSARSWFGHIFRSGPAPKVEASEAETSSWLQQYGLPSQLVVSRIVSGQGRGLFALGSIRKGEALLRIPEELLITTKLAEEACILTKLRPDLKKVLPDWTLLVLFLVELRYHAQQRKRPPQQQQHQHHREPPEPQPAADPSRQSPPLAESLMQQQAGVYAKWAPYYEMLPELTGCVLDWPPDEVDSLLAGSGLQGTAKGIITAAAATWQDIQKLLSDAREQPQLPADLFSKEATYWAISMCLTRSVRLDSRESEVVLLPWGDLVNHDVNADCFLDWDEGLKAVVLKTDRSYKADEQVFVSYGPKSSGELLICYGFCPPPGSNPHDAAHINLELDRKDPLFEQKAEALRKRGIPLQWSFALRIDALPAGLMPYLALVLAQPSNPQEVEELAGWLFDRGELPVLDGQDLEVLALQGLARICRAALKGYPQDPEADKVLAAQVPLGGGFEQRAALCATVRLRERQILARTEFVAGQQIKALRQALKV